MLVYKNELKGILRDVIKRFFYEVKEIIWYNGSKILEKSRVL